MNLHKIFHCNEMPPVVRTAFHTAFPHVIQNREVEWEVEDRYILPQGDARDFDTLTVDTWLLDNGCVVGEIVVVKN